MSALDELETRLYTTRAYVNTLTALDPFERGQLLTYIDSMFPMVRDVQAPTKPALAPGKHEPEPIILTAKKARPRVQKGQ